MGCWAARPGARASQGALPPSNPPSVRGPDTRQPVSCAPCPLLSVGSGTAAPNPIILEPRDASSGRKPGSRHPSVAGGRGVGRPSSGCLRGQWGHPGGSWERRPRPSPRPAAGWNVLASSSLDRRGLGRAGPGLRTLGVSWGSQRWGVCSVLSPDPGVSHLGQMGVSPRHPVCWTQTPNPHSPHLMASAGLSGLCSLKQLSPQPGFPHLPTGKLSLPLCSWARDLSCLTPISVLPLSTLRRPKKGVSAGRDTPQLPPGEFTAVELLRPPRSGGSAIGVHTQRQLQPAPLSR